MGTLAMEHVWVMVLDVELLSVAGAKHSRAIDTLLPMASNETTGHGALPPDAVADAMRPKITLDSPYR